MSSKAKTNFLHVSFRKEVEAEAEIDEFIRSEAKRKGLSIKAFLGELVKAYKGGASTTFDKGEIEEIIRKTVREVVNSTMGF